MKTVITELLGIQHRSSGGMDYVGFAELAVAASNAGGLDIRKQSRSLPM